MRIDVVTGRLFTDSGEFLKRLSCPLQKSLEGLSVVDDHRSHCDSCSRPVYNTAGLADAEVENLLAIEPDACLVVSTSQANVIMEPRRMQNRGDL